MIILGPSTVASEESISKWESVSFDDMVKVIHDFVEKNRELNRKTDEWNKRLAHLGVELRYAKPGEEGYSPFPPNFGIYSKSQENENG